MTKLVKVTWLDAQLLNPASGHFGPAEDFEDVKPIPLEVVGWLIRSDRENVILANERCPETGEVKLVHVIPRRSILKITSLEARK